MTPMNKNAARRSEVGMNAKKRKILLIAIVSVMLLLAVLSNIRIVKQFLTVKKFEITGISVYESVDIINASGVKRGDLLYSLNDDDIEKKILSECPYLSSVKVTKKFPNTLCFDMEGKSAQWYIDIEGTKYSLDGDLVMIAQTERTEGMTKLVLPNLKSVIAGQVPEFGQSETEVKKTLEIISAVRSTTFKKRITELDLQSRWDIHMTVDGSFYITMGDTSDFAAKLKAVEGVLNDDSLKDCVGGEMNVFDPANPAFKPVYSDSKKIK